MNKKHSKRWEATEQRLEEVTLTLMEHSALEQITVRAICDQAGVNRTTFYEHFLDVYDLFDHLEAKMRLGLMDRYEEGAVKAFSTESFLPLLKHIKENQNFYDIILKTRNTFPIEQGFERLLNEVVRPLCLQSGIREETDILYYLVFFQAGFTLCLRRWVEENCQKPEEEIAQIIASCLPESFKPKERKIPLT